MSFAPGVGAESPYGHAAGDGEDETDDTAQRAETNPCAPIHAATATNTPPMSSAAMASAGGGVSAQARRPRRRRRSANTLKSKPAWAPMCVQHHAAAAKSEAADDVDRFGRRQQPGQTRPAVTQIAAERPQRHDGEQRAERAALPDTERRDGGVQRQHEAGAGRAGRRLQREIAGAELAHPVADALGHGALDRRAGEAVG